MHLFLACFVIHVNTLWTLTSRFKLVTQTSLLECRNYRICNFNQSVNEVTNLSSENVLLMYNPTNDFSFMCFVMFVRMCCPIGWGLRRYAALRPPKTAEAFFKFSALQPKKGSSDSEVEARESQSFNFCSFSLSWGSTSQMVNLSTCVMINISLSLSPGGEVIKSAQMYRSCGNVVLLWQCANIHRHECKMQTLMVLERF